MPTVSIPEVEVGDILALFDSGAYQEDSMSNLSDLSFALSKLLPLFIYPLGLVCLLLAVALLVRRSPRWQSILLVMSLGLLWLGSNQFATMALVRSLEWRHLPYPDPQDAAPQADLIVVLGGATRPPAYPRPTAELNEAGSRLLYAAHLYTKGTAPRILVSGGIVPLLSPGSEPEAESMAEILTIMGVPRESILLESGSRNTYENAIETRSVLKGLGAERVLLVTSAMHMPRAYWVFDHAGIEVIPAPTDFIVSEQDWHHYTQPDAATQFYNLLPKVENLYRTTRAMKEYIGIVIYRLRGWI
jgi:uncharacterized SAM-binding protein YcdF (DUF218 family)